MLLSFRGDDEDLAVANVAPDSGAHLAILDFTRVHVALAELLVLVNANLTHGFSLSSIRSLSDGKGRWKYRCRGNLWRRAPKRAPEGALSD
jgi:hypothetical protein